MPEGPIADEQRIHRNARKLRKLATQHRVGPLRCAGDGLLVADSPEPLTQFVVAGFCEEATRLLGGRRVDLVSGQALTHQHVANRAQTAHPL